MERCQCSFVQKLCLAGNAKKFPCVVLNFSSVLKKKHSRSGSSRALARLFRIFWTSFHFFLRKSSTSWNVQKTRAAFKQSLGTEGLEERPREPLTGGKVEIDGSITLASEGWKELFGMFVHL